MVVSPTEAAEVACHLDACEDAGLLLQPPPAPSQCRRAMTARTAVPSALALLGLCLGLCLWLTSVQQQALPDLAGAPPVSLEEQLPHLHAQPHPLPQQAALSAGSDNTLKVWDLASGQCLRTLERHTGTVKAVAADFARHRAVSGGVDRTLRVWNLATGQFLRTLEGHTDSVVAVAADFARQRAVSASFDQTLKVWDLATGQCLRTLRGHEGWVTGVVADFARQRGISASIDHTLKVWDLVTGRCLRSLRGHRDNVNGVAADLGRLHAISASQDSTLKVWDLATGQCLRTLRGHEDPVFAVAADFARQRAISTSWDWTLKVWDLASGRCLRTLRGHNEPVLAVAADFARHRAISAAGLSEGGTLKVWDLASGQCLKTIRADGNGVDAVVARWAEEPFKLDCLARAEMSWLPRRQLVNLTPWEKREYSEELVSKAALAAGSPGSGGSHSSQRRQRNASAVHHSGSWGSYSGQRRQRNVSAVHHSGSGGRHSSQRRQRNVSAIHHSLRRLAARAARALAAAAEAAGEAPMGADDVAELFGGAGAAGACALTGPEGTALAPLCVGLGQEAGKHLAKLFEARREKEHTEEEETTKSHGEGYKTSRRSVTGQSKHCTHSLKTGEEPVQYRAWQPRISLTYTHQIFPGENRSITIHLDIPGVDLLPTGHSPGKEYGTLPRAPETGCYSKSATDTISAIIKGSCRGLTAETLSQRLLTSQRLRPSRVLS